jgi:hypothetical protein
MNIRNEFREAFRQYKCRFGLPLANPSSDIHIGDLCFFNTDGSVITLGNVLDGLIEERFVSRSIDHTVDPIISNGMRCHHLSNVELDRYFFKNNINVVMNFRIIELMRDICCLERNSMFRITHLLQLR